MKDIVKCIKNLRVQLERHRKEGLKEYPTRAIFIDPLLGALGWDVRDPDEVALEHPTVDSKSVDYAMKVNRKVVLHVEAKQLRDQLDDVKAITQVVGYAANDGIEWCVLTNGVKYKVYKVSEKASAPDKLLFEVSIDPKDSSGLPVEELAQQFSRLSRESIAKGLLDQLGAEIFTTGKVRKVLDRLFLETPQPLIRLIRKTIGDASVTPFQIEQSLHRIWDTGNPPNLLPEEIAISQKEKRNVSYKPSTDYTERHHTEGKPNEVLELYRGLDRFCQNLAPGLVIRAYKSTTVNWAFGKSIFCCAHLQQGGLRVWVKTDPKALDLSASFARDVSKIGHWGVGDVELAVNSLERLHNAEIFIKRSFENATRK
ncbi:MAG: type I restriction enzyme HsdR N-terminal domain-containing protein [Candidatus Babeliaceae bacterium]|nr:type I restriction enzyme HsdR N-terminal domain-containing protein [Candidatus Babeliaceae bacterium]